VVELTSASRRIVAEVIFATMPLPQKRENLTKGFSLLSRNRGDFIFQNQNCYGINCLEKKIELVYY